MSTPSAALVQVYAMKMLHDKENRKNLKTLKDDRATKREQETGASAYNQGRKSTNSDGCFAAIFKRVHPTAV
ncbi:hypothetical protein LIER_43388 [Lithospermum erythrorhizon]|uniref:Uncharacterized protein n=1 Tax=Lithospermum erythrorhizon TaxID=34254 RepID=A0AAV3Q348_LITER